MAFSLNVAGSVVYRCLGTPDGGTDYVRIEGPNGVIELHPANNSARTLWFVGSNVSGVIQSGSTIAAGSYSTTMSGGSVTVRNSGSRLTWDDLVYSSGTTAIVIHTTPGMAGSIPFGTPISMGVFITAPVVGTSGTGLSPSISDPISLLRFGIQVTV